MMISKYLVLASLFLLAACGLFSKDENNDSYTETTTSGGDSGSSSASDNNTTFVVTVSAGKYSLDNVQGKTLILRRGNTYSFDAQDSSTASHPLYLGTSSTGGGYSDEYTSGVDGSRTTSGILTIVIPQAAPNSLYYNCGLHSNMGAEISIVD